MTATRQNRPERVERVAHLRWVPVDDIRIPPLAQREKINQAKVARMAEEFDPELLGSPTVNKRDGHHWVLDGMHRVEVMRMVGWGDQSIQCWTYEDLSQAEEAEMFLRLNDSLPVPAFDRFTKGVNAGREVPCEINRIVLANDLVVSRDHIPGAIRAVSALQKVYERSDSTTLGRTLRIIRDAYGDPGMESLVIDGIGHVCERYNGLLNDEEATVTLARAHGGVGGLLNKAEQIRRATGHQKAHCMAAAAVEIINGKRKRTERLPDWWST